MENTRYFGACEKFSSWRPAKLGEGRKTVWKATAVLAVTGETLRKPLPKWQ